jgi:SAM-dependent methyltransferase
MAPDASNLDPLRRFSDRVENYVKYRPDYPAGVFHFLAANAGLSPAAIVADIGAGTGIFTRQLLETGARVIAVEPNDAMRAAAEAEFRGRANFESARGSGEESGLPDASVSLITCAQAFHWLEPARARREFMRILRPGGRCALVWNTPIVTGSDFAVGYERIKEEFGTDFHKVRSENIVRKEGFDAFFGVGRWGRTDFGHFQTLDYPGLKGRMLSSSYAPKEGHPRFGAMLAALEELFERCRDGGVVRMEYTTEVFLGTFG